MSEKFEINGNFSSPYLNGGYRSPQNPQVEIIVSRVPTTKLVMSLEIEGEGSGRRTFLEDGDSVVCPSKYIQWKRVDHTVDVSPGRYVALLCTCGENKNDSSFSFTVEKNEGVESVELIPDNERTTVGGRWGDYGGGFHQVERNPQYLLKVKEKCKIQFTLTNPRHDSSIVIADIPEGLLVANRLHQPKTVTNSRVYVKRSCLTHEFVYPDKEYIISPTVDISKRGEYNLILESETPDFIDVLEELQPGVTDDDFIEVDCLEIIDKYRDPEHEPFLKENPCEELMAKLQEYQDQNYNNNNEKKIVFKDTYFPATMESVTRKPDEWDGCTPMWKRPEVFLDNPQLFIDGPEPDDFIQGGLGDCWLIASLSVYCRDEETVVERIFPPEYNYFGFYIFKFFKADVWKYIIVDDLIPLNPKYGSKVFASSRDDNELYVSLIEKAFAKIWKSYHDLKGNIMSNAFQYFGGEYGEANFRYGEERLQPGFMDGVWKKILEYSEKEWLMGTSFHNEQLEGRFVGKNLKEEFGLVPTHAYSVLSAVELSDGTKLLRLRNPWGSCEWNGDFSDNDEVNWTEERKSEVVEYQNKNDGAFFFPFDVFPLIFPDITFYSDKVSVMKHKQEFKGMYITSEVPERNCFKYYSFKNPKIQMHVEEDDTKINISYSIERRSEYTSENNPTMMLSLMKGRCEDFDLKHGYVVDDSNLEHSLTLKPRDLTVPITKFLSKKGDYWLVCGSQFEEQEEFSYCYRIVSSKKINCVLFENPSTSTIIKKTGKYCSGNWLSYNNPKFDITLNDEEEEGGGKNTELEIVWKRTDKKEVFGQFPMILMQDRPEKIEMQLRPGTHYHKEYSGGYVVSNESCLYVSLPNNGKPWTFFVTGAKKFAGLMYELKITSDKNISVSEMYI